jgi:hypothetical protein
MGRVQKRCPLDRLKSITESNLPVISLQDSRRKKIDINSFKVPFGAAVYDCSPWKISF